MLAGFLSGGVNKAVRERFAGKRFHEGDECVDFIGREVDRLNEWVAAAECAVFLEVAIEDHDVFEGGHVAAVHVGRAKFNVA